MEVIRDNLKALIDRGIQFVQIDLLDILRPHNGPNDICHIPSGPIYEEWLQDVNTYNERYLKNHTVYQTIRETIFFHKSDAADKIMGAIKSVYNDNLYWSENEHMSLTAENIIFNKKPMYDVFISHANADKPTFVDDLKKSLDKLKISVFYDKSELEWGDNWKNKILDAIDQAEFAIIIISENFFNREWTEKELNNFFNRQNENGQKIILPILYNISIDQLKSKYPFIADIQSIHADTNYDEIALLFAAQLIKRLKAQQSS